MMIVLILNCQNGLLSLTDDCILDFICQTKCVNLSKVS